MKQNKVTQTLISAMLAFFVMGFVDLVGISVNYVKIDFELSDTLANLLPSMVFFWFLIFSVPTGLLMNHIGRRKTVVLSLIVTSASLALPIFGYNFGIMLASFSLLGIGNTLMQVSINPLMSNIVGKEKLASYMTFGQFVKAIASFLAPIIAGWAAMKFGNWKLLFPIFMSISILTTLLLWITNVDENKGENIRIKENSSFKQSATLIKDKFIGIMCHVGIDVGINTTAPKLLMERMALPLESAGISTSIYFLFRTIGSLSGAFILSRYPEKIIFRISVLLMVAATILLFVPGNIYTVYGGIALVGLGNANIFPIILAGAMAYMPDKKNEVSSLMIMGLFGGTIFPLLMGVFSDAISSQNGALSIIALGVLYLIFFASKQKMKQL